MNDKLKLLLDKINLNSEFYKYFENGKIIKIISSKDKLNWNFIIETPSLLPIEVLDFLDNNIKNGFEKLNSVTYTIKSLSVSNSKINDYYPYVINSIGLSHGMITLFSDNLIKFTTDGLVIATDNRAQENIIKNNLDKINKKFKQIGFDVNLKVVLNEEDHKVKNDDEIKIEVDMTKITQPRKHEETSSSYKSQGPMPSTKKVRDSNAIIGTENMGNPIEVSSVNGEMDNVTIEAYVFGIDIFESSKSSFKIITLKVSDNSDSLLTKIFFRNEEDFNRVKY